MNNHVCEFCGCSVDEEDIRFFDDTVMCEDCYNERTTVCSRCGETIWVDDNAGDEDTPLCQHCRDYYYTTCEDCGRLIDLDDARYLDDNDDCAYCDDCYSHQQKKIIHDYYYKPEPVFHGDSDRFFGVELEIDDGGESDGNAKLLFDIANKDSNNIYIKHDGSIDEGMELVTHPMSLQYHLNSMPWHDVMDKAISMGYLSHKTSTCGLHVHVNRNAFGDCAEKQDECISRILFFVERFWQELLRFSRRTESQIQRWAARYGVKNTPKEVLDHAKSNYVGRYTCVNLTNYSTIEFRIFRGTLKYSTFVATLQLVNLLCDVAITMSDDELTRLSWPEFVESISEEQYPELISYLKERRLFINEPVMVSEEV